jgi:hypothetical protein
MPLASEGFAEASPASGEAVLDPEEPVIAPEPVDAPELLGAEPVPPDKPDPLSPLGALEPLEAAEAPEGLAPAEAPDAAELAAPLFCGDIDVPGGLVPPHAARTAVATRGRAYESPLLATRERRHEVSRARVIREL